MTTMRIYVGTYAKYNSGSLNGAWLDLADYSDRDEFYEAVNELHKDEIAEIGECEPMFQDWEGIPEGMVGESHIDAAVWELIEAYDNHNEEAVNAYCSLFGEWDEDDFQDRYSGEFEDDEDFAYELIESCGDLQGIPDHIARYFDYVAFARDLMCGDYTSEDGHYFRNC